MLQLSAIDVVSGNVRKPLDSEIAPELRLCPKLQEWLICEIFESRDPDPITGKDVTIRQEGRASIAYELLKILREE